VIDCKVISCAVELCLIVFLTDYRHCALQEEEDGDASSQEEGIFSLKNWTYSSVSAKFQSPVSLR
jgi:hypothetical protein